MADQQRWFKLWYSAVADDSLQKLTPAQRWAWVVFGLHTKVFGHNGTVTIHADNPVLAAGMGIPTSDIQKTIALFPNIDVKCDGEFTVTLTATWRNWHKYQKDSSKKRTADWRANVTEQKRREQKRVRVRGEESRDRKDLKDVQALSGKPDDAQELLSFLNHKTGRNFQSQVNLDFIRARLKAGATEPQCRAIIGLKTREWRGTEMEKYLRPATLFNATKFAQYLGELPITAFSREGEDSHA